MSKTSILPVVSYMRQIWSLAAGVEYHVDV